MFGPPLCHLDQWQIFYWPKKNFLGQLKMALISGTAFEKFDRNINIDNIWNWPKLSSDLHLCWPLIAQIPCLININNMKYLK